MIEQIPVGGDRNFAYVIGCEETGDAAVVDPSYAPDRVLSEAASRGLRVLLLVNTHGHHDHTNGNETVVTKTGATVVAHPDAPVRVGHAAAHEERLSLGTLELCFLHTPGHSADSLVVCVSGHVLTGDTLFVGKIGGTRTDADARRQYDSLHERLLTLPDETIVLPGHDVGVTPTSTIGRERKENPFLLQPDFAAFLDLKKNWLAYKKRHGIA